MLIAVIVFRQKRQDVRIQVCVVAELRLVQLLERACLYQPVGHKGGRKDQIVSGTTGQELRFKKLQ